MGFTHYYRRPEKLDTRKFKIFVADVKKIYEAAKKTKKIAIVNGMGEKGTKPVANEDEILFNGTGENAHETLHIPRIIKRRTWDNETEKLVFDFCKTARKPYDKIVTAVLVSFKHHFPEAEISSDGENEDFAKGKRLCKRLFGYGETFKLGED